MRQSMKFVIALVLSAPLHIWHIWRDHILKTFGAALLLASGLAITGTPARALQIVVTQVDKNTDGSMTYHFAVKKVADQLSRRDADRAPFCNNRNGRVEDGRGSLGL